MKFFRKVGSVLASGAMLTSTLALAAAASFPAPYIKSGNADVGIVHGGAEAAFTDLVAVTDIATHLSSKLAEDTTTAGGTSSGASVEGDNVLLARSSDNMNLGDDWSIFGTIVDDDDLPATLGDGTYLTDENEEHDYTQKLNLGNPSLTFFEDSDYNSKENTIGFKLNDNTFVLNYTLDFTTNPESDVSSGDLVDLETTELIIMGKEFFIFDADNSTLDLTLLDSANSVTVSQGDVATLTVNGTTYEVSITFVNDDETILSVNGVDTGSLAEKQTQKLPDGSHIGIKDIRYNSKESGVSSVEFSIGSGKLFLDNEGAVELNDDGVDGLKAYITRGSSSGARESIDKIVIEWVTDDEEFLTPDQGLVLPGFESVQFLMSELVKPFEEMITIENDGDDSIRLTAPIKDGDALINILHANESGEFTHIGKDSDEKLKTSSNNELFFNISDDDRWFVVSWNSSSESESYFLEITSSDLDEEDGINKTTIKNVVTGDNTDCVKEAPGDTCDIGSAQLTINEVFTLGNYKAVNITGASDVSFDKIYTDRGLKIQLPVESTTSDDGAINFSGSTAGHSDDSFWLFMTEENKDDDVAKGTKFNVTLNDNTDGNLQVSQVNGAGSGGPNGLEIGDTDEFETYIVSDLATRISHKTNPEQDSVEITYHGTEAFVEVYATEGGATLTSGGVVSGGTGAKRLGSVSVPDTEVASVSSKNLIVVGGSCVNSVAAELLGISSPTCGPGFTSATNVGSGQFLIETFSNPRSGGKIATLVAGYNAPDTTNAAKYLTTQTVDTTVGNKYVGTTATSAQLVVS